MRMTIHNGRAGKNGAYQRQSRNNLKNSRNNLNGNGMNPNGIRKPGNDCR